MLTADGEKQIVCGAPNARAGIKVVVSKPGDYIPGIDTTIKVGKIRGVESHGMMLSEREMELSDAHAGIVELPPTRPVGARYIDVVPFDPVIDIAITPNRPDALGVAGIARDLAARGLGTPDDPAPVEPIPGAFPCPVGGLPRARRRARGLPALRRPADPRRPERPLAAVAAGPAARHRPAPDLGARRHHQLHHLRPQPAAARLRRRQAERRRSPSGWPAPARRSHALDGKDYTFDGSETLVCDATGPEAIGGVMGGMRTGCTEATSSVFVEAAWFDPVRTARTGRRLRDQLRRPLPLRARRRPGLHPARASSSRPG